MGRREASPTSNPVSAPGVPLLKLQLGATVNPRYEKKLILLPIDVAPDGISITLHAAGIYSLVAELAGHEALALAASEPLLEAAE